MTDPNPLGYALSHLSQRDAAVRARALEAALNVIDEIWPYGSRAAAAVRKLHPAPMLIPAPPSPAPDEAADRLRDILSNPSDRTRAAVKRMSDADDAKMPEGARTRAPDEAAIRSLRADMEKAQSACAAWQNVFLDIEAHLLDRIAMNNAADPERYLSIIRSSVDNVNRESAQIVAARWADYRRQSQQIADLEAIRAELVAALRWLKPYAEVQVRRHPEATDTPNWRSLLAALARHDATPGEQP